MLRVRVDPKPVVKLRIADRDMPGYAFGQPESRKDAKCRSEFELAMLPFIVEAGEYRRLRQASADWFGNLQLADFRVAHDILLRTGRSLDFRLHRRLSPSTICHKIASCAHNARPDDSTLVSRYVGQRAPHSAIVGSVIQHSARGRREHGFAEDVLSKYVERPPDYCDRLLFIDATQLPFADSTRPKQRLETSVHKNSIASVSIVMRYSLLDKSHPCRMLPEEFRHAD